MVVRDWFQVVIWYNRMKKLKALQGFPKYYQSLLSKVVILTFLELKTSKAPKSKSFHKDFMNDFVEDLVDYQHLVEIEEHRLNVYRQLWELVSYSLSIDDFSLIYTNKEEKLILDINNTSVRYKI